MVGVEPSCSTMVGYGPRIVFVEGFGAVLREFMASLYCAAYYTNINSTDCRYSKSELSSLCRWIEEGMWMRSNDDIEVRNCFCNLDVARISRVSDCDYSFHTLVVKFIMDIGWGCKGKYLPLPLAQQPPFAMILFRPWKWPDNINLKINVFLPRISSTFPELEMNLVCGVM